MYKKGKTILFYIIFILYTYTGFLLWSQTNKQTKLGSFPNRKASFKREKDTFWEKKKKGVTNVSSLYKLTVEYFLIKKKHTHRF